MAILRKDRSDGAIVATQPPPYTHASSSDQRRASPATRPVNNLYVEQNRSIEGSWVVDPGLTIPPNLFPGSPTPNDGVTYNLRLLAKRGNIKGSIDLIGDTPSKATIFADAPYGNVHLTFPSQGNQHLRLVAKAGFGGVKVYLPRDFRGLITYNITWLNGTIKFSEMVSEAFTPFNHVGKTGKGFIGELPRSQQLGKGEASEDEWDGDGIELEGTKIKVLFVGEEGKSRKGLFG